MHGRVDVAGRPGLVLDRLDGADLLATLLKRPWRVRSVARTLGAVHASLHEIVAPPSLPALRSELEWRLRSDLVPGDVRDLSIRRLSELPDGDRLCHGDFHPANLLPGGRGHLVIDWTSAVRGDPAADVARTRLLIRRAFIPANLPPGLARLIGVGRRVLLRGYLREYSRRRRLDLAAVERWEAVLAAARLAEDIPEERDVMLGLVRTAGRAAGSMPSAD